MGTQIGNKNLEVSNTDEAESEFDVLVVKGF